MRKQITSAEITCGLELNSLGCRIINLGTVTNIQIMFIVTEVFTEKYQAVEETNKN